MGLSILEFGVAVILLILFIYILYRIYMPLKRAWLKQRILYKNSEKFYFRNFQKAARAKNKALAKQSLYRWIDQLQLEEPTLIYFVDNYGTKDLLLDVQEELNTPMKSSKFMFKVREWSEARRNYIHGKTKGEHILLHWINP